MRKLLLLLLLLPSFAHAQLSGIVSGATPIDGGTTGQVVSKGADGTVAMIAAGGAPTGAAGGVLAGTYPNPSFAAAPGFSGTTTTSGATTTGPDFEVKIVGDTFARVALGLNTTDVARVSFGAGTTARDLFLERVGAASLRLGATAVDTTPVAQTISVQNVLAGGTSNVAGANWTFAGSQGKGTGIGGSIIFQTAPAGSTGSTVNALVTALTINTSSQVLFADGTEALPAVAFAGSPGLGFRRRSANLVAFSAGGVQYWETFADVFKLKSTLGIGWSSDTTGSMDTTFYRTAANAVALGTGSSSSTAGRFTTKYLQSPARLFSTYDACSATLEGSMIYVTDSTTVVPGATITGSGVANSGKVIGWCNAVNWKVMGI